MPTSHWEQRLLGQLDGLAERRLRRSRRAVLPLDSVRVRADGRDLINFASNDYLGLSRHPRVLQAAESAIARYGFGSGAAPLITGYTDAHAEAEATIAAWKGAEAAVLFSSGYQANVAVVQMLSAAGAAAQAPARFLLDKLCHASIIDAVRSVTGTGDSTYRVFPHNGIDKLERLLGDAPVPPRGDVILTESVFSMDGDAADLPAIARCYGADDEGRPLLVVDEAHGSGVYGPAGAGWAAEAGVGGRVDITVATLSKSLGCVGAAVCGSRAVCDAIVNLSRAYIFSTSMPACVAAAAGAAIGVLRDEPARQARLRSTARAVRKEVRDMGWLLPGSPNQPADSPIIPILLGEESAALAASDTLRDRGLLALAIRPPTVPKGSSRLRITLSSEHSDSDVYALLAALRSLKT